MKTAAILMAATMVIGGTQVLPARAATTPASNSPTTAPAPMVKNAMQDISKAGAGVTADLSAGVADAKIRDVIANLTFDALTPNDMPKLISLFAAPQQERISKANTYSSVFADKFNTQVESIDKTWKQKYGHGIALSNLQEALSAKFTTIQPSAAEQSSKSGLQSTAGESATFAFDRTNGKMTLQTPMVCEQNADWKIDVPSSLTAQKLHDNLLAQLTSVSAQSAHWPANESAAYRLVSHRVLLAVLDKPMPAPSKTNNQAAATVKPTAAMIQPAPAPQSRPYPTTRLTIGGSSGSGSDCSSGSRRSTNR